MRDRWGALILFLGAFYFYLYQSAPSVTAGDSGEFITSVATLSLAHSPSFPLYMITGRCFQELLPWGSSTYRINIFSSFTSALTLVISFFIGRRLGSGIFFSFLMSILLGLSQSFLENSLVTEVFSLNTFLALLLILISIKAALAPEDKLRKKYHLIYSFILGLGLGNHHILIFVALGWVVVFISHKHLIEKGLLLQMFFLGVLGFSIYGVLPVRAHRDPPLNWGQPTTARKVFNSITRRDYGSFRLSVDESPARNRKNTWRQLVRFEKQLENELTGPWIWLSLIILFIAMVRRSTLSWSLVLIFIFSGPVFYLLGNLPFTGQSEGIMGRFYILPIAVLLLMFHLVGPRVILLTPFLLFFGVQKGWALEWSHRHSTLILDYGRSMMRILPPRSILFMDGGDDAFYSLAALQYVDQKRTDLTLHDRGGLVFKNPYGDDFRQLSRDQKKERRTQVERAYIGVRPLYYSTMDTEALPGSSLLQKGFLYEAASPTQKKMNWELLILRSLYPPQPSNYRTRALAAFFPYMRGREALHEGDFGKALSYFRRAQEMGFDVDWLKSNLGYDYAHWGYSSLTRGRYELAEWIYRQWIEFDPSSMQAQSNLGVVLEKQNKIEEAKRQYKYTLSHFPMAADPVFNLAVMAWKSQDWAQVIEYLEEVLRRDPNHLQARIHLEDAKKNLRDKNQ